MKITYLGTAAAEGQPAPFCDCPICRRSRQVKGRNVRSRSQSLIDGDLLLDFPADTYMHSLQQGFTMLQVRHLLVTHSHSDHYYPTDLFLSVPPFGLHGLEYQLQVYGNEAVKNQGFAALGQDHPEVLEVVRFNQVEAFVPFTAGEYRITPLSADHCYTEKALFYLIEKGGKALLYAHDTGYFLDPVWEHLAARRDLRLDLVSLDCTHGFEDVRQNHMGFAANSLVRDRLVEMGLADEKTVFVSNHFSHNCGGTYEELSEKAGEMGFLASYDGMTVEF